MLVWKENCVHEGLSNYSNNFVSFFRHKCLFGKKLVSKNAFQTGADTTLIDEMMSMCTLSGWLNETIGAYTCTKDCKAPTNYSEIFTYNWSDDSEGSGEGSGDGGAEDDEPVVVEIGTIVKYKLSKHLT